MCIQWDYRCSSEATCLYRYCLYGLCFYPSCFLTPSVVDIKLLPWLTEYAHLTEFNTLQIYYTNVPAITQMCLHSGQPVRHISKQCEWRAEGSSNQLRSDLSGGPFKNTFELLNLRAIKFTHVNKIHLFQCMGKIFVYGISKVRFEIPHKISYP